MLRSLANKYTFLGVFLTLVLVFCVFWTERPRPETALLVLRSGGKTTVAVTSREAFAKPAANLPTTELRDFTFGNKMFNTNWVAAPASVKSLDGLGPMFNRVSCSGCHFKDGRGRPPLNPDEAMDSMLIRLSLPGHGEHGEPLIHPSYGDQLNTHSIDPIPAEGQARVTYTQIIGRFKDGTPYTLEKPTYHFENLAYGPLDDVLISPRVAPVMIGLGLLEAIPEADILYLADEEDKDGDGISGRPNYVWDLVHQKKTLGRFGWKANQPSLFQQTIGAALGDIGITSSALKNQNCMSIQGDCINSYDHEGPEISNEQLKKLVFYTQTLAVPARRNLQSANVQRGASLFASLRCTSCHVPEMTTGEHPIKAISNQKIHPFTDLLLHDMGPLLADNRPDFEASGREWRTPPLWGIGLVKTVNRHTRFMHDGRARNLEEAVLWHGGEAEKAKKAYLKLSKKDRASLIAFLESL